MGGGKFEQRWPFLIKTDLQFFNVPKGADIQKTIERIATVINEKSFAIFGLTIYRLQYRPLTCPRDICSTRKVSGQLFFFLLWIENRALLFPISFVMIKESEKNYRHE